jgi:hypothetical protein
MSDHTLIPPVSGTRSVPQGRTVPRQKDQKKRQQQPPQRPGKKDQNRPSIDEYA